MAQSEQSISDSAVKPETNPHPKYSNPYSKWKKSNPYLNAIMEKMPKTIWLISILPSCIKSSTYALIFTFFHKKIFRTFLQNVGPERSDLKIIKTQTKTDPNMIRLKSTWTDPKPHGKHLASTWPYAALLFKLTNITSVTFFI